MKEKQIMSFIIILIVGFTIGSIIDVKDVRAATLINTFNDSSTAKNLTFTGNQNLTTWITLPKQSRVINAQLNLSGYNGVEVYNLSYGASTSSHSSGNAVTSWGDSSTTSQWFFNVSQTVVFDKMLFQVYAVNSTPIVFTANFTIYICPAYDFMNITCKGAQEKIAEFNTSTYNVDYLSWKLISVNTSLYTLNENDVYKINFNASSFVTNNKWRISDNSTPVSCPFGGNVYRDWSPGTLPCHGINASFINQSYPTNPYLDVSGNATHQWSFTGTFNQLNNRTANFSSSVNSYLSTCSPDANDNCNVPLNLSSSIAGIIQISDLNISYSPFIQVQASDEQSYSNMTFNMTIANDTASVNYVNQNATYLDIATLPQGDVTKQAGDVGGLFCAGPRAHRVQRRQRYRPGWLRRGP